jgi:hypothetical protein
VLPDTGGVHRGLEEQFINRDQTVKLRLARRNPSGHPLQNHVTATRYKKTAQPCGALKIIVTYPTAA